MTYIQTFSGKKFSLIDPQPEDICIEDVAHHLGLLCRFVGATRVFYSVAQHSILVASIAPKKYAYDGLMHDAGEAYYGDISSPLRGVFEQACGINWSRIITNIDFVVSKALNFIYPLPRKVEQADIYAFMREECDFMKRPRLVPFLRVTQVGFEKIIPLSPAKATKAFLKMWRLYKND